MKKCVSCGFELPDEAGFCSNCGAVQASAVAEKQDKNDPHVTKNILLCPDGKYRWVYELNLMKDWSVAGMLAKIFGGIILAMIVIGLVIELFSGHNYLAVLKVGLIMIGIFAVLILLGYLLYAAIMGGKYCVSFTMDDSSIIHEQQPRQVKKADLASDLLILAGALSGSPVAAGIGATSGKRTAMQTDFKSVKKLTGAPKNDLIKLDASMDHNRVWCEEEDFDFVWNYIKSRCEGAQIIEKF